MTNCTAVTTLMDSFPEKLRGFACSVPNKSLSVFASRSWRVLTAATAREKNLIKTDTVCLGKGLTEVFEKVFAELPLATDQVNHCICDMNGEPYRADEFGFAILRVGKRFVNASDFVAPADCWGDVGAASGPLFVNLVSAAGQRGMPACGSTCCGRVRKAVNAARLYFSREGAEELAMPLTIHVNGTSIRWLIKGAIALQRTRCQMYAKHPVRVDPCRFLIP